MIRAYVTYDYLQAAGIHNEWVVLCEGEHDMQRLRERCEDPGNCLVLLGFDDGEEGAR